MGVELAVGALIAGAGATLYASSEQQKQQKKIASAQKKVQAVELAANQEQAARERRAQIREARIQRAAIENLGAATGQQEGSAAIVGGQGVTAQMGQNIGNINTALSQSTALTGARQEVVNKQAQGPSMVGQLAGMTGGVLTTLGSQGLSRSIFKE